MGKASFRRQRRGLRPSLSRGPKRPRYGAKKQRVIGTQMRGTSTRGTIIRRKSLEDDKCIKAIEVLKDINKAAKLFRLNRKVDETGVSGTGIVAEGVKFSDGKVAIRWTSEHKSTTVFDSMKDLKKVHGHNGKTKVEFMSKSQETKPTAHIYNPKDFGRLEPSSATKSFNVPFETPKWIYPEAQLKKPSFPIFKSYDSSTPKYDYHQMRSSLLGKKAEEHAKDLSTAIRSKDKEAAKLHASKFHSLFNDKHPAHVSFKKDILGKMSGSKNKHWGKVSKFLTNNSNSPKVKMVKKPSPQEMQAKIDKDYGTKPAPVDKCSKSTTVKKTIDMVS